MSARSHQPSAGLARVDRPTGGFTLIELVVVIAITGVLAGVTTAPLVEATRTHHRVSVREAMLGEARTALDRLLRELRDVQKDPSDSTAPDLDAAQASQIDFETISYRLSSGSLERSEDGGMTYYTLASQVTALTFSYFDESGTALTSLPLSSSDRKNVRRVQVALTLTRSGEILNLQSSVQLRRFAYGSS